MGFIFRKYILFVLLGCAITVQAQNDSITKPKKKPIFTEKGFMVGYGYGLDSMNVPEGQYCPIFFIARLGITPFKDKFKKIIPGTFSIVFEPQFNPVAVHKSDGIQWDYEFGVNAGIQYSFPLAKYLSVYTTMSAGPHFMSNYNRVQARGFLFSDHIGFGVLVFPTDKWAINLGFRARHMSNAQTRVPNHGVNTLNYFFGISKVIR